MPPGHSEDWQRRERRSTLSCGRKRAHDDKVGCSGNRSLVSRRPTVWIWDSDTPTHNGEFDTVVNGGAPRSGDSLEGECETLSVRTSWLAERG